MDTVHSLQKELEAERWLSEERRKGLEEIYDELLEFRKFLVDLKRDMEDEPASYAVSAVESFIKVNSETWYGGNTEHWEI
jgi:predicted transcriptional regulator